jgi:phosphatidylglycerophosphate synthase
MTGAWVVGIGDRIFAPACRRLARSRASAIAVNAISLAAAVACGAAFATKWVWVAVLLLIFHGFFDYADGALRRAAQSPREAALGDVLRHTAVDKLSDLCVYLSLAYAGLAPWWLSIATCASSVTASALGVLGHVTRRIRREDSLVDRSDRIIAMIVLCALSLFSAAVVVSTLLSLIVTVQRAFALGRSRPNLSPAQ